MLWTIFSCALIAGTSLATGAQDKRPAAGLFIGATGGQTYLTAMAASVSAEQAYRSIFDFDSAAGSHSQILDDKFLTVLRKALDADEARSKDSTSTTAGPGFMDTLLSKALIPAKIDSKSWFILYYCGHGITLVDDYYFAGNFRRISDIRNNGLPLGKLLRGLARLPFDNFLIVVDSCREKDGSPDSEVQWKAAFRELDATPATKPSPARHTKSAVMFFASEEERSVWTPDTFEPVFTRAFNLALKKGGFRSYYDFLADVQATVAKFGVEKPGAKENRPTLYLTIDNQEPFFPNDGKIDRTGTVLDTILARMETADLTEGGLTGPEQAFVRIFSKILAEATRPGSSLRTHAMPPVLCRDQEIVTRERYPLLYYRSPESLSFPNLQGYITHTKLKFGDIWTWNAVLCALPDGQRLEQFLNDNSGLDKLLRATRYRLRRNDQLRADSVLASWNVLNGSSCNIELIKKTYSTSDGRGVPQLVSSLNQLFPLYRLQPGQAYLVLSVRLGSF
jgi:hypothetical protein